MSDEQKTPEELEELARQAREADAKRRWEACTQEITEVLKKYNCRIYAKPSMVQTQDGTWVTTAEPVLVPL